MENQTNLVYEHNRGYIGETSVRFGARMSQHSGDKNSSIYKDSVANGYDVSKSAKLEIENLLRRYLSRTRSPF